MSAAEQSTPVDPWGQVFVALIEWTPNRTIYDYVTDLIATARAAERQQHAEEVSRANDAFRAACHAAAVAESHVATMNSEVQLLQHGIARLTAERDTLRAQLAQKA